MMSNVYIRTDHSGRVIACEGGYTTPADLSGWTLIDSGAGDRYNLCQSLYFPGGLTTDDGIPRWKFENGACVLRTEAEMVADKVVETQKPVAGIADKLSALLDAISVPETPTDLPPKPGFRWKLGYTFGNASFAWVLEPDPDAYGTVEKPIPFIPGNYCTANYCYSQNGIKYICLQSGVASQITPDKFEVI